MVARIFQEGTTCSLTVTETTKGDSFNVSLWHGSAHQGAGFFTREQLVSVMKEAGVLEADPKVITFSEVRKGDKVRVTRKDGEAEISTVGVAFAPDSGEEPEDWETPDGRWFFMEQEGAVIELLERPVSREQQIWEEVYSDYHVPEGTDMPKNFEDLKDCAIKRIIQNIVKAESRLT